MDVQTRVETRTYGTITHMAPEVLRANIVSKAADVYSFGVILWEMAAGCRAWVGAPPPSLTCSLLTPSCLPATQTLPALRLCTGSRPPRPYLLP